MDRGIGIFTVVSVIIVAAASYLFAIANDMLLVYAPILMDLGMMLAAIIVALGEDIIYRQRLQRGLEVFGSLLSSIISGILTLMTNIASWLSRPTN